MHACWHNNMVSTLARCDMVWPTRPPPPPPLYPNQTLKNPYLLAVSLTMLVAQLTIFLNERQRRKLSAGSEGMYPSDIFWIFIP